MATNNCKLIMNQISTVVAALTPGTNASTTFTEFAGQLDHESAPFTEIERRFYFSVQRIELEDGAIVNSSTVQKKATIMLNITWDIGMDINGCYDRATEDVDQICNAFHDETNWDYATTGVVTAWLYNNVVFEEFENFILASIEVEARYRQDV